MQEVDPYSYPPVQGEVVDYIDGQNAAQAQTEGIADILHAVLRRWYIVLICAVFIGGGGAAAILFLMPNKFETQGSIHLSQIATPIMYETEGRLPPYDVFRNTQVAMIANDTVLNRVADEVKDKNLAFFTSDQNLVQTLRQMVTQDSGNAVSVVPIKNTEIINVSMTTEYPKDAETLIDAFLRSYETVVQTGEISATNNTLATLETKRRTVEEQIRQQKAKIRERVEEYGTEELKGRQEISLQQVATLQQEQVSVGIRRMLLETQVKMKQDEGQVELTVADIAEQMQVLTESDPVVGSLREDIRKYEFLIRDGQATMLDTNPEMVRRREILQDLQKELEKTRQEVSARMEQKALAEARQARKTELNALVTQLNQTIAYEEKIRQQLATQDASTISIGRTQLDIDDLREEYDNSRKIFTEISRRIEELNIERDREPRISVASWARSVSTEGKTKKMAAAAAFGGLAMGLGLALLLGKLDHRVHGPDQVSKRIGVRIIGTTIGPEHVSRKLLGQQLLDDYQTIRANLGLLDGNGSTKLLVITSPGMGDGKSTLSVNLATSFARSGRKTLLIDGDLHKPDVAGMLNLPTGLRGLQDYLFGGDLQKAIYKVDGMELSVLAADTRNTQDALELLTIPETPERIRQLRDKFDYIIIDTPPVLAFSDAMVWAKMADGVIMTSFIGHTSTVEMKEALERLYEMKANVIGTIVNNVKVSHSYRRYGYGYGYGYSEKEKAHHKSHGKRGNNALLISMPSQPNEANPKT